jgi:hypothetical protein
VSHVLGLSTMPGSCYLTGPNFWEGSLQRVFTLTMGGYGLHSIDWINVCYKFLFLLYSSEFTTILFHKFYKYY